MKRNRNSRAIAILHDALVAGLLIFGLMLLCVAFLDAVAYDHFIIAFSVR